MNLENLVTWIEKRLILSADEELINVTLLLSGYFWRELNALDGTVFLGWAEVWGRDGDGMGWVDMRWMDGYKLL